MKMYVTSSQLVHTEMSGERRRALFDRARERATIEWFGKRIAACFADPVEAVKFRLRNAGFLAAGSPDMCSCAVRADDGEMLFWTEPGAAWRYAGPSPLTKPGLVAFLADRVTQKAYFGVHPSILSFHAAALQVDNAALAISATSTGGKTTTAIACTRRGMGLYTDERCIIMEGRVHPFPRSLSIRRESLEILASEEVRDDAGIGNRLRQYVGTDWKFVTFADLLGHKSLPEPRPLKAIFFIEERASAARVTPLARDEAITQLLYSALCGPASPPDRLAAATAVFQHARGYALTLGRPDETALLIVDTMRNDPFLTAASSK